MDFLTAATIPGSGTTIFVRSGGHGPPLLLLHGFPQTHLMWHAVVPQLARTFTVVCADLRGYGRSGCPASTPDHSLYSKRSMAADMVAVMERLGFSRFSVAGHDRGGRVAYRMALDHPERIDRLAVLDIVPTETMWEHANAEFSLGFWPWSFLAQPAPLPERVLAAAADAVVDHSLDTWGSPPAAFPPSIRRAYAEALQSPDHAHAICEEYRAAAGIDRDDDRATRAAGRRIVSPLLVLWSRHGALDQWFVKEGGPLGMWQPWATHVEGHALDAGHFFPEEVPEATANAFERFFAPGLSPMLR